MANATLTTNDFTESAEPSPGPRIQLLGFVADVRPLYVESNLVIVPTTVGPHQLFFGPLKPSQVDLEMSVST